MTREQQLVAALQAIIDEYKNTSIYDPIFCLDELIIEAEELLQIPIIEIELSKVEATGPSKAEPTDFELEVNFSKGVEAYIPPPSVYCSQSYFSLFRIDKDACCRMPGEKLCCYHLYFFNLTNEKFLFNCGCKDGAYYFNFLGKPVIVWHQRK